MASEQQWLIPPSQLPPGAPPVKRSRMPKPIAGAPVRTQRPPADGELSVTDAQVIEAFRIAASAPILYVDTETKALDRRAACGIGLSMSDGVWATYIPWGHRLYGLSDSEPQADLELVKKLWSAEVERRDPASWRAFNKQFDWGVIEATLGTPMPWHDDAHDVMHLSFLVDENDSHKLKELAVKYIDPTANEEQQALAPYLTELESSGHMKVPPSVEAPYAAEDARLTASLDAVFAPLIDEQGLRDVLLLETRLTPVLTRIEDRGMLVDVPYMSMQEAEARLELDQLHERFRQGTGFDGKTSSTEQLRDLIYGVWKLPVAKLTEKGEPSVDKWAIEALSSRHPEHAAELSLLAEISTTEKLISAFFEPLQRAAEDGVIHTSYRQMVRTGRTSSARPNLQQLPTRKGPVVRKGMLVRPGMVWVLVDYSQVELRVLAHYCQSPRMLSAFRSSEDLHEQTAGLMGISRSIAKTINFGQVYGAGIAALARNADVPEEKARQFKSMYRRVYPEVGRFTKIAEIRCEQRGWVKTISGRRRRLTDKYYRAGNAIVQGSAADIAKGALVGIDAMLQADYGDAAYLIGFVHDEALVECPAGLEGELIPKLKELMCGIYSEKLTVPLAADAKTTSTNWGETKKWTSLA